MDTQPRGNYFFKCCCVAAVRWRRGEHRIQKEKLTFSTATSGAYGHDRTGRGAHSKIISGRGVWSFQVH